jgi:hypothetical protein
MAALDHVSFKVPDGACDCHHHVYDPSRWAYAPATVLKPPPATIDDYRRYQTSIGTSRCVVVTPSTYEFGRMHEPSFSQRRLRAFCFQGTFSPSRRHLRWTRSVPTPGPPL